MSVPDYCPITYTLTNADGTVVDSEVITFASDTRTLTFEYLDTLNFALKETVHNLRLTVASVSQSGTVDFQLEA